MIINADFPGLNDVIASFKKSNFAIYLGWLDVKQRYRRSKVGPFWITLSMSISIAMIGLVFGTVFKNSIQNYIPYLSIGIVLWNYILATVIDSCNVFVDYRGIVLERPLPLYFHLIRVLSKNTIIFLHNLIIIPPLFVICGVEINAYSILSFLGFVQLLVFLGWISLLLGIICARFRDCVQIITSVMQIFFYFTPVIWMSNQLPQRFAEIVLLSNPFYYFIQMIRNPLLDEHVDIRIWVISFVFNCIGWFLVVLLFNKYRNRITYWV